MYCNRENYIKKGTTLLITTIMLLFVTSCSNVNNAVVDTESGTLRYTADKLDKTTTWTSELEGDRLTKKVESADGIDKTVEVDPSMIFASGNEQAYQPIYPAIPDFAVLNTSTLDESAITLLDGFCTAITKNVDADSFMAKNHLYSLVLFQYDLNQGDKPLFSSYVIGEPFVTENAIQCPIRFYYDDSQKLAVASSAEQVSTSGAQNEATEKKGTVYDPSLDVYLYLVKEDSSWKIDQISYDLQEQ